MVFTISVWSLATIARGSEHLSVGVHDVKLRALRIVVFSVTIVVVAVPRIET